MILEEEGLHQWSPHGASTPAFTFRQREDDGSFALPRVKLKRAGLGSLGAHENNKDNRVGAAGVIHRPSFPRERVVPYEGTVQASTRRELQEFKAEIRAAFADRDNEGRMDVVPHPLDPDYDAGEGERYFNARVVGLEMENLKVSPNRPSRGHEATFVLALEMSDPYYYEEMTLASFKQAIIDLEPELYWALDSVDGVTDLSGNGNDGTGQGSVTLGGAAALTAIPGDSATDFDGTDDRVTSTYGPFVDNTVRTYIGLAWRDTSTGDDNLFGGDTATVLNAPFFQLVSSSQDVVFATKFGDDPRWDGGWPGVAQAVPFAVTHDTIADEAELFVLGASLGVEEITVNFHASPGNFEVGMLSASTSPFDGKMSHIAVFERALTAQQIADISEWATTGSRAYQ